MKSLLLAAALSLAAFPVQAEQPPLTRKQVGRMPPGDAAIRALAQLGDQATYVGRPARLPAGGTTYLDEMDVALRGHASGVPGLCELQMLRLSFEPTEEMETMAKAKGVDLFALPHTPPPSADRPPIDLGFDPLDPDMRARTISVENRYIPLPGYNAGAEARGGSDDAACAELPWKAGAVRANSAWVADAALSIFNDIQAQAQDGHLQFNFVCTLDGVPCSDPTATFRKLLSAELDQVGTFGMRGHADGLVTEGELSGRLLNDPREWWANVAALNGTPTRVELHVAVPAPS